ncbi:MAG: glycosyltransferase family 4 protein [Elusimicrobiota bacterium]
MTRVVHFDTGRGWRGGQNQVYLLIRELKKMGVDQLLVVPEKSPLEEKGQEIGVKIKNLDPANDIDIIRGLKLRKIVKKYDPGTVHFHTAKSLGIGALALRKMDIKTVFTRRVDFPIKGNYLNKLKYGFPDKLVVISDFIKKQIEEAGFKSPRRIYSAVDTKKYRVKRNYRPEQKFRVGMVGALDLNHKDFLTFIRAARKIQKEKEGIKFHIAGTGKDRQKIADYIEKRDLAGSFVIEGFVEDMSGFFVNLDVLVHTVHYEGLGTSVLEGMAAGLPVIATGVGGLKEVVKDGETGFLVDPEDDGAVSNFLKRLLGDKNLRESMGTRGTERVEDKFCVEKMAKSYLKIYRKNSK